MKQSDKESIAKIKDKELHRIAATCIIYNKENKYLVTKRSPHKKVQPNRWTVPGGALTTDDYVHRPTTHKDTQWYNSLEKALRREVKEEVNVKIGKITYLIDLTFIRPDGIPVLVLSYYAPYKSGNVKLDEDAVEYRWVSAKELNKVDLIPGIDEEILMVDRILKKENNRNKKR